MFPKSCIRIFLTFLSLLFVQTVTAQEDFLTRPFYYSDLTYYIESSQSPRSDGDEIIERALNLWAEPSGLTFTRTYSKDNADIEFIWTDIDGFSLGVPGKTSLLSFPTQIIYDGEIYKHKAVILLDKADHWLDSAEYTMFYPDLMTDAVANIGLAIGLGYSDSALSAVYYVDALRHRHIGVEDYIHLISLYGTNQEVLELPLIQNFEGGTYSWSNTGEYAWFPNKNGTPTSSTGPGNAADGTYYAFVESNGKYTLGRLKQTQRGANVKGETAILESPLFDSTYAKFNFSYFLRGRDIGTLYADIYSNGTWKTLWSTSVKQARNSPWKNTSLDLGSSHGIAKVRLRYVAGGGYRGDAAIDSISVTRY